jgi:hypothetical protein
VICTRRSNLRRELTGGLAVSRGSSPGAPDNVFFGSMNIQH